MSKKVKNLRFANQSLNFAFGQISFDSEGVGEVPDEQYFNVLELSGFSGVEDNNPAFLGQAEEVVSVTLEELPENDQSEVVTEEEAEEPEEEAEEPEEELENLPLKELKEIAKEKYGIDVDDLNSKAKILKAIKNKK